MKVFLLSASLRKDSYNTKLINLCARHLKSTHSVKIGDFTEFDSISYNQDVQDSSGIPANVSNFAKAILDADRVIFSVPEYNYSISGCFKNLIDWTSRIKPLPFKGAKILLLTASPANAGGTRSFWATRIPLEGCGAFVYPSTFALSMVHQVFDQDSNLKDSALTKNLSDLLDEFMLWRI